MDAKNGRKTYRKNNKTKATVGVEKDARWYTKEVKREGKSSAGRGIKGVASRLKNSYNLREMKCNCIVWESIQMLRIRSWFGL